MWGREEEISQDNWDQSFQDTIPIYSHEDFVLEEYKETYSLNESEDHGTGLGLHELISDGAYTWGNAITNGARDILQIIPYYYSDIFVRVRETASSFEETFTGPPEPVWTGPPEPIWDGTGDYYEWYYNVYYPWEETFGEDYYNWLYNVYLDWYYNYYYPWEEEYGDDVDNLLFSYKIDVTFGVQFFFSDSTYSSRQVINVGRRIIEVNNTTNNYAGKIYMGPYGSSPTSIDGFFNRRIGPTKPISLGEGELGKEISLYYLTCDANLISSTTGSSTKVSFHVEEDSTGTGTPNMQYTPGMGLILGDGQ